MNPDRVQRLLHPEEVACPLRQDESGEEVS